MKEMTLVKIMMKPGLVTHGCNPSTQEAKAVGFLQAEGQHGLHIQTRSACSMRSVSTPP